MEQLPEQYAEAWTAWREEAPAWAEWRPKVKADPGLGNFFVDNLVRVLVKTYDRSGLRPRGELAGPFERASRELIYLSEYSAPVMIELIPMGDTIISFLAGDLLVQMDEGKWCLPLAAKLEGGKPEDRRRAAEWLGKMPFAGEEEGALQGKLEGALQDPAWTVRVQTVHTLGLRARARGRIDLARPALCRALGDASPEVVRAACAALTSNGDTDSVPALINLMERGERSESYPLIEAAQTALEGITGHGGSTGSVDWRRWWGDWWKENRS